jgi:hypothetical protein
MTIYCSSGHWNENAEKKISQQFQGKPSVTLVGKNAE